MRSLMPGSPKAATMHGAIGVGAIAWRRECPRNLSKSCPSPRRPIYDRTHGGTTRSFNKGEASIITHIGEALEDCDRGLWSWHVT